jgi:hypothetical protein
MQVLSINENYKGPEIEVNVCITMQVPSMKTTRALELRRVYYDAGSQY